MQRSANQPYPVPENEQERLEEILRYDFADGGAQGSLDRICALAQSMFQVPVALITLLDRDEQVFLAKCGVNADGTSRKDAFCNYTILNDEVLVVTDATEDARFAANPLVTGDMHIRFYAGAPLEVSPGIALGSLCLIDQQPRSFSEAQEAQLKMLANVAVNELRRRMAMIDLRREQELLAQAARMTKVGSWALDIRSGAVTWSLETYRIFGVEPHVVPGPPFERHCAKPHLLRASQALTALIEDGVPFDQEFQIVTARGAQRWIRSLAELEIDAGGEAVRVSGSMQDITRQHEHAAEVERLAFRDALTGLPNRALFQRNFCAAIKGAQLNGTKLGLIMLDLDHFKDVNDTLGHDAGDALLKSVSRRLRAAYRKTDTIARLGGDEFAVILPGIATMEDLVRPTEVLLEVLRHPVTHCRKRLSITASAGIAFYSQDGQTPAQLLKDADIALYQAKAAGRNRLMRFEIGMRQQVEQRVELLRDVRAGIAAGQFELFYQPLVTLSPPRRVTGFEGLMRWRHPARGLLTPDTFAAAFEDQELSLLLGEIALDSAMRQMRAWMDRGVRFGRIAVNLSASQFRTGNLAGTVGDKLRRWNVPADRLTLEVTENVYMGWSSDVVATTIHALHDMGILIALDDFGTGYASLANLRQFPIDRLKIDKSFVQNDSDAAIVKAVLTLGASMGMKVVAEGVEDGEKLEELRALGCDQAQGYYFARPMAANRVAAFLKSFPCDASIDRNVAA